MADVKRQKMNKTMQLIHHNKENKLVLNKSVLEIIRDLEGPIAICACVGQYRVGKSFLLGQLGIALLSERSNIFDVTHGQDNCTKGLWINSDIKKTKINNTFVNVIFVDSQGIDSSHFEEGSTRSFIFSYLFSSLLMFNTHVSLPPDYLIMLGNMMNIANNIKINLGVIPDECPVLFSVVRNFTFIPKCSEKEQIERSLKMETMSGLPRLTSNKIQRTIINSFSTTDCCRLTYPAYKVKILQNIERYELMELDEKFQEDFSNLSHKIDRSLKAKSIGGKFVNGIILADYVKIITDMINQTKLSEIYDTIASIESFMD